MYICKANLTCKNQMKLKILRIMAIIIGLIGTTLFNRFMEGGALFMSLILSLFVNINFLYCEISFQS